VPGPSVRIKYRCVAVSAAFHFAAVFGTPMDLVGRFYLVSARESSLGLISGLIGLVATIHEAQYPYIPNLLYSRLLQFPRCSRVLPAVWLQQ
jgi:hypothetical protein